MPRRFILFLIFVVFLALFTINMRHIIPAHAETRVDVYEQKQLVKSVVFVVGLNEYYVNNQIPGVKMDARPFIKDGRTFVPVRYLGNALGVADENITWDGGLSKVGLRLGPNSVEMVIGVPRITSNGQAKEIDVAPILNESEGRTYLPARYIAEGLGFEVDWDETTRTILCWPKGEVKPDIGAVKQKVIEERAKLEQEQPPAEPQKPETLSKVERALGIAAERGYALPPGLKELVGYSNKYKLSSGLWVRINPPEDNSTRVEFGFLIPVGQGTEIMREDAYKILESKFGPQLAREMIDYAAQKKDADNDLPTKYWRIYDRPIRVGSKPGDIDVDITIWEPGVKLGI